MRYTTGLLIYALLTGPAAAADPSLREFAIFALCDRADPVLSCRVDDQGTNASTIASIKKQIVCIIGKSPMAAELLAKDMKAPLGQTIKMVVSFSAIELIYKGTRGEPMAPFRLKPEKIPDTCDELDIVIGPDYGTADTHVMAAYVRAKPSPGP